MKPSDFDALAERILHSVIRKDNGYTPPGNAHMLVDTALALASDLVEKLETRHATVIEGSELTRREINDLHNCQDLQAIKSVRERLGLTLKGAKKFVDEARKKLGL